MVMVSALRYRNFKSASPENKDCFGKKGAEEIIFTKSGVGPNERR